MLLSCIRHRWMNLTGTAGCRCRLHRERVHVTIQPRSAHKRSKYNNYPNQPRSRFSSSSTTPTSNESGTPVYHPDKGPPSHLTLLPYSLQRVSEEVDRMGEIQ